ncbi:SLBB domain-containing protein [Longimicrobium sp.]|uniref:SLBB domain-containing protein n=1 Tax=Longimicrobium sp. TaxID=2029185 RepID=UPI002ED985FC
MTRIAAAMGALLVSLLGGPAHAQDPRTQQNSATQPQSPATAAAARMDELLLDAPVNRARYQLGPGDVVTVSITGNVNRVWQISVSPEGAVVVPELGVVRVLNLNLDEAQARVRDLVLRFYQGVGVNLTLSGARRFRVFVAGSVSSPGTRVASPATRVSDLVPQDTLSGVVRRNVVVRRADGDSVVADMARFRLMGDLDANPNLREGDVVLVPTPTSAVQVHGRVHFPGTYELRQGESLADLLQLVNAGGGFPADAADTVRVSRFVGPEERRFHLFSQAQALGPEGAAFRLQPSDAVFTVGRANFRVQHTALVVGQVLRPGVYPIRPDTTTVRELVAMAGGFTSQASLTDATLRRQARGTQGQQLRELQNVPAELLSEEERRILRARGQGDPGLVVIDFERLFQDSGGSALDQTLEPNDVLSVPERRTGVTVLGAVRQPGIIQYAPGRGVDYYVRLAGGYGRRADRGDVTVLRARLGAEADARDVARIEAGDQIVVPIRRRIDPLQTLQSVQAVVGVVSGFALTILALDRYF